jgi:hypothetical protein
MRRATSRPFALVACVAALVTAGSGCARLVTLSPEEVNFNNETSWKLPAPPPTAAGSLPVTPIGLQSPAMRDRPDIRQALGSPPDSFGIPTALYAVDPILLAHRNEMREEASARNRSAAGIIALGLVLGGISAWAISANLRYSNSTDQSTQNSASEGVFFGGVAALLSLGEIVAGVVLLATSPNSAQLTSYYRETYTDPR